MFIDMMKATQDYWQKLDQIESLYQQGELSIQEVDQQVDKLMQDLGQKRRESLRYFRAIVSTWLSNNVDLIVGLVVVIIVAYTWIGTI